MSKFLLLMRPHQWSKQALVYLPLISLGKLINLQEIISGILAVITFTTATSMVYAVNDLADIERDKLDPVRAKRPIASGRITLFQVSIFIGLNFSVLVMLIWIFSSEKIISLGIILIYLVLNLFYSIFELKKFNILGISLVAIGFPIRFAFGCAYLGIEISYWAAVLLMELALFMLSIKRFQRTLRTEVESHSRTDHEFWLLAAVVFVAFFSASYAGFVSAPGTQAVWGSEALLLSAIPIALAVVRFIELGTNSKLMQELDVTDSFYKDLPLLLFGSIYVSIMLIGNLTNV